MKTIVNLKHHIFCQMALIKKKERFHFWTSRDGVYKGQGTYFLFDTPVVCSKALIGEHDKINTISAWKIAMEHVQLTQSGKQCLQP